MRSQSMRPFLAAFLAVALVSPVLAQRQTGGLAGKVVDIEGRPLPGATVSLTGPSLMGIVHYVTSDTGLFRFAALLPGEYDLRAEMPGFKSYIF
jgi:protocatechuate 3,4-dioxygenase beta subunit